MSANIAENFMFFKFCNLAGDAMISQKVLFYVLLGRRSEEMARSTTMFLNFSYWQEVPWLAKGLISGDAGKKSGGLAGNAMIGQKASF